jgi:hypothetical protein
MVCGKTNVLNLNVIGGVDMDDDFMEDMTDGFIEGMDAYDIDDDNIWVDDIELDDIPMDELGLDNIDYTYEHWHDTLEQSYDPIIDPDADVGENGDDNNMDDVMVDLTLYEMELKIMGLQLELHELESRLKCKRGKDIPQTTSGLMGSMWVHWVLHNPN